jgi:uncharacterized membrane protein
MTSTSTANQISTLSTRRWFKPVLWTVIGASTLSVVLYSEIPLLRSAQEKKLLHAIPWLLIPHICAGLTALVSGPLQFSSRLRRRNPKFHRILGRIYVSAVFVAAPLAIAMASRKAFPQSGYFFVANVVQAGTWLITTTAAFLTARNRHIQQHREWMVRSYAVTFTFVATRVFQPIPAWNHFTRPSWAMMVILFTFMAVLVPDLAFHWRELTTRRA